LNYEKIFVNKLVGYELSTFQNDECEVLAM